VIVKNISFIHIYILKKYIAFFAHVILILILERDIQREAEFKF